MKERILYEDDFEKQLKEKTDQFKMYPSDKVWSEVYGSLHTRRRRFVAGMTFLIGGILILAGSQLIFPSRNTISKSLAVKINNAAKAATVADLQNYIAGGFSSPDNISGDSRSSDGGTGASVPFIHRPSADSYVGTGELIQSVSATIQTPAQGKPVQQANLRVSEKTEAITTPADLNEPAQAPPSESMTMNSLAAESIPEKSPTQLTHIHNDRLSWEIYIAPTFNTHYLYGLNYQTPNQPIQSAPIRVGYFTNVNGFVDNTPVLGYDVGGNILYRISKNISLKAGLEFSFSRYYIKAYNPPPGQAAASLNSYFGYVADSLVNYATGGGATIEKNPQHYQNRYYQLSIPVGVDMKVAGNGKLQLHLGGTVQPSYLLNTDAYVLSDDLNTYTKDGQAFRRWNLNAGAEVYLSYAVGKIRWELGPQVKYQIFSTYKNSIPLQENMLNYGIRIGISKSIR
jgi:hypothetical protein